MNDFNKEKLITLKNGIEYLPDSVNLDRAYKNRCDLLIEKIRAMIDNYCVHDGEVGKDYPGDKCMKCMRMWE